MRLTKNAPLYMILLSITFLSSGCTSLVQEVQNWSGNRIEIVDDLTVSSDEEGLNRGESSPKANPEHEVIQSPKAHQKLDKILQDKGRGKYAGEKFNRRKINEALDLLPKGLSEEKIYAYLLGLVGENYYQANDLLDEIAHTHYRNQMLYFQPKNKALIDKSISSEPKKPVNVVVLLNASHSMANKINGKHKLELAKETILKFSEQLPANTSFTFRVYGHQANGKKESCAKSDKIFAGLGKQKQLAQALRNIKPIGWTPLAKAIENAHGDLKQTASKQPNAQNIVLVISDRYESCGKDPIKTAKKVYHSNVKAQVHLIGLDVDTKTEKELKKVSDVSNGNFETVSTKAELQHVLQLHSQDIERVNEPWQLKATDKISRNYASDKILLHKNVNEISEKIAQEYQRLDEANQYIKEKQKINHADWTKLDHIIEKRKDQVEQYADIRLQQLDTKLNQEYKSQTLKIEKSWVKAGQKKEVLAQRKQERLKFWQETQNKYKEADDKKQE